MTKQTLQSENEEHEAEIRRRRMKIRHNEQIIKLIQRQEAEEKELGESAGDVLKEVTTNLK